MIYLHSGRPGSGKTLFAISRGIAWRAEGRNVYHLGIDGLNEDSTGIRLMPGATSFEDKEILPRWSEVLKPGDVLIVDEVHQFIERGSTRLKVPDWIERLTRNRHYGVDLLFTSQDPKNLEAFVRRLVNEHRHYVNKHGALKAKVYTWPDGVEEVDSPRERDRADVVSVDYPVNLFGMYTSAVLHTRKKTVPRKVKVLFASLAVCVICTIAAVLIMRNWMHKDEPARSAGHPSADRVANQASLASRLTGGALDKEKHVLTLAEWREQLRPRVDGMLWTAPLYDDRKAQSDPETYCMSMENGPCKCISDQGTRVVMSDGACRVYARDGMYNPFKAQRLVASPIPAERQQQKAPDRPEPEMLGEQFGETGVPSGIPTPSGVMRNAPGRARGGSPGEVGLGPFGAPSAAQR